MGCIALGVRTWRLRWLLTTIVFALAANVAWGQTPRITRVEEDWELVLGDPSMERDAPQVTCAMSPSGDALSVHAVFELNHRTLPVFAPGGVQLQIWYGETPLSDRVSQHESQLNTSDEKVTWTQAMDVNGAVLVFEILNGSSTTWGSFGGQGSYKIVTVVRRTDLNSYSPEYSVNQSGVGYGGNRVKSLILKQVRYITVNRQQFVDANQRIVHPQP